MKTHLKLFIGLILLYIALTACGPSQAEVDATSTQISADILATQTAGAPTATSTFTPSPTYTNTPLPTQTPTATPTFTPSPTKDPLAGEFVEGKFVITDGSLRQLTEIGQNLFSNGWYLYEALVYDAMLEYSLQPDQLITIYNMQSEDYEYLGHYDLAIEDYLKILVLGDRRAGFLNSLCWNLAITNRAEEALPYCEEAVEKDPSSMTLDSRGVAYALLGRYPEAVSDFNAALDQGDFPNDEMIAQRQQWVTTLEAGTNPITEEVLAQERGEESSIEVDPWYEGELKLSYLIEQYERDGYTFSETTIDGQPGQVGRIKEGNCQAEIILLGNEQEFLGGSSTILRCSHEDTDTHAWNFVAYFSRDLKEMAKAIVWENADCYYVIEGKPVTDLTPTFGGFQFSMERTNVNGDQGIIVTAKPGE